MIAIAKKTKIPVNKIICIPLLYGGCPPFALVVLSYRILYIHLSTTQTVIFYGMNKTPYFLRIKPETIFQLRELSKARSVTVTSIIEDALEEYLSPNQPNTWPDFRRES